MSVFQDTLRALMGEEYKYSAVFPVLESYAQLMLDANEHINLTAITDIEQVAAKHFADSLMILKYVDIPQGARLLDVGTGAGFPGVPLLISRTDLKVTLLDGTAKKLNFIKSAAEQLGIHAEFVHSRAEEGAKTPSLRGAFDVVTARAVADLPRLCEYCLPFLKVGGYFVAMKGADYEAELDSAKNALKELGGELSHADAFELGEYGARSLIVIKKISHTSPKYPRASTAISKKPL